MNIKNNYIRLCGKSVLAGLFLSITALQLFGAGGGERNSSMPSSTTENVGMVETGNEAVAIIETGTDYFPHKIETRYADGFSVEYHNTYKYVRVFEPYPSAQSGYDYLLIQRGAPIPKGYKAATVVFIPVRSFVSLSSSYLAGLDMLGVLHTLVAVDSRKNIYNSEVRRRVQEFEILEVTNGYQPNVELLFEIDPDCIMASALGNDMDVHPKLFEANFPIVVNGEWIEEHPLGRAEWIKFLSLFYNKEEEANYIFSTIEQQYEAIRNAATSGREKPSVFAGAPFDDVWYMPGGNSYAAQFFEDAGADYLWSETVATGSLALDFESVFYKASDADIWLNAGYSSESLEKMLQTDERYGSFKAFKTKHVYANIKRMADKGGNDYWESGVLNPHVILADLVKILYPELLPEHELFYYQQLH